MAWGLLSLASMPSMLHEALVLLFRNRPLLAAEIIRDVLARPLPDFDRIEIQDSDLAQLVPTEYRADQERRPVCATE